MAENDPSQNQNPDKGAGGPAPAFDADELKKIVRDAVQQEMSTMDKDLPVEAPPATYRPQASENPLQAVLEPIVGPALRQTALIAESARDAATFYANHPEAGEHRGEIERIFDQMFKQGTPFPREDVYKWYKGANMEKFVQKQREADEAKIQAAKENADSAAGVRPNRQTKSAYDATDEELSTALKDVAF